MERENRPIRLKKKRSWQKLPKEERQRLIKLADSLFIPPNFVASMYENGSIN